MARILTLAFRGLAQYSDETESSPRSSVCGLILLSRVAFWRTWQLPRLIRTVPSRTQSRARCFTRCAQMKWRCWERFRLNATTAPSMRRRSLLCSLARITSAPATVPSWNQFGQTSSARLSGSTDMAIQMVTVSWNMLAKRNMVWFIRAGKILTTRFSTGTALLPKGQSRFAKCTASELAKMLGDAARARELSKQAETLHRWFEEAFWCDELSTYALALDGSKRACRVCTSNARHCLFTGVATEEHARRLAGTLTDETSFSGWGIRTVASSEVRSNPMSYHNGSVWPHDNALVAAGFARYGLKESAAMVLAGLLDASLFFDLHRQPELFCGFPRRAGESPTLYPVACAPQAWASGAVFLLLEGCLGLSVSASEQTLVFSKPILPAFLPRVSIRDLRVGDARVDLLLTRHDEGDVGVNVLRRDGALEVLILK